VPAQKHVYALKMAGIWADVMMCVTSYEVVTFNGPATIRFLLESLSRYYCRKYPLQDFSVVASMQKYNLTDLNNGLTQLGNITLWSKSCADHDGSGGVPKKQPHDHKTHWGPALNWYKGLPKPEDEKDNKLPASVVTPDSAASNPTCYPPRYLHLHPRALEQYDRNATAGFQAYVPTVDPFRSVLHLEGSELKEVRQRQRLSSPD
jgi:hypothetical protein